MCSEQWVLGQDEKNQNICFIKVNVEPKFKQGFHTSRKNNIKTGHCTFCKYATIKSNVASILLMMKNARKLKHCKDYIEVKKLETEELEKIL